MDSARQVDELDSEFVARLVQLERDTHRDKALDELYRVVRGLLRTGYYNRVDVMLRELKIDDLSLDLILGFLTATLPARSRLASRAQLKQRIEDTLRNRGEYRESLLSGL